jgi:hypothetical protein
MTDNAIAVTLVTANASQDALTDADYLAIIDSLRGPLYGYSWQRIADETGYNSKAYWHQVSKGARQLDDEARNALRRVTDGELPEQPPSVAAVTDAMIDVDAAMYLIGALEPGERVRRVLMLADGDVAVYVNGEITAKPLQAVLSDFGNGHTQTGTPANVTHVTGAVASVAANREPVYRPVFSTDEKATFEALGGLRRIIDAGVKALQEDTP